MRKIINIKLPEAGNSENGLRRFLNEKIAGSTLPSLDACKKIANRMNDPSSAIWMAIIAPRMVFSQNKMTAKSFFLEKIFSFYFDGE